MGSAVPGGAKMTGTGKITKTVATTGDQLIDSLLVGTAWDGDVTFAFPTTADAYGANYSWDGEPYYGFAAITELQKAAAQFALDADFGTAANNGFSIEGLTGVKISLGSATTANLRFAQSDVPNTAWAYYPSTATTGGDLWFGTNYDYKSPVAGNYAWATMLHEVGHAMGLKHPHETRNPFPALSTQYDAMEYSIMSYRSYLGASTSGGYTNEEFGYAQSYMMLDIAALQEMYGADFTTNAGNTVYKWSPGSGNTLVNGQVGIAPGDNRIFATIWDGEGIDTYDLSDYLTSLTIDLRPGVASTFSATQLAGMGYGNLAAGNIYNALLYKGDVRSLIENATGGSAGDSIRGNQARNTLIGNGGDDTLFGMEGDDVLNGGNGADRLDGDTGSDTASYAGALTGVVANLGDAAANTGDAAGDIYVSIENLAGSNLADTLTGDANRNVISGGGGVDRLDGGDGDDVLMGGLAGDRLIGGVGSDTASYAGALAGIVARLDNASVNTGEAAGDTYSSIENLTGSSFADALHGNGGANKIIGGGGKDVLHGYAGTDTLDGGSSDDVLVGGANGDRLIGGSGIDTASYAGATQGVLAHLDDTARNTGDAKGDSYSSIENLTGGDYADTLYGSGGANVLSGGGGADNLYGRNGADKLDGGSGHDTLYGGSGADRLIGGLGTDTAHYGGSSKGVVASLEKSSINTNDAKGDTYSSIENLSGTGFADKLYGNTGKNTLSGGAGADQLYGQNGDDTLLGDSGDDTLYGGNGRDSLDGGTGHDILVGGADRDVLIGGAGTDTASYLGSTKGIVASLGKPSINTNDAKGDSYSSIENLLGSDFSDNLTGSSGKNILTGGKGNDTMTGGGSADIFVYKTGYGRDTITDFQNNADDIDVRSYNFASVNAVLSKSSQVGNDVQIKFSATDVIVLKNFDLSDLNATDFLL